jgi:hypothetical protein
VSPVGYELDFISQKTTFFIVTAVKTSDFTQKRVISTVKEQIRVSHTSMYIDYLLLLLRTWLDKF